MYKLYVLELPDEAAPGGKRRNAAFPCVYVGQSWHSAEVRLAQHKAGIRASRHVKRHGGKLMPQLYEHLAGFRNKWEAEIAEKHLAKALKKQGYTVRGGH